MSFGAGMAAGMGAGMGSGIAIGISSGRKKAASEIREYVELNGITILDRQGAPLKVDQLLDDAVGEACGSGCGDQNKNAKLILLGLLGVLVFGVAAAVAFYIRFAG